MYSSPLPGRFAGLVVVAFDQDTVVERCAGADEGD